MKNLLSSLDCNPMAGSPLRRPRPSWVDAIQSHRVGFQGLYGIGGGNTFSQQVALEGPFNLVRLLFANGGDSAYTITNAAVAASAFSGNGYTASSADGSAAEYTQVTFNNGGADGLFPSPTGAVTACAVPPMGATFGYAASDWMHVAAIPRADAGQVLPLLHTLVYNAAVMQGWINGGGYSSAAGWPSIAKGRIQRSFYQSGQLVTVPAAFSAPAEADYFPVVGVQYYQLGQGVTLMTLGDSLTAGLETTAKTYNFGFEAASQISDGGLPCQHVASGFQGQTSAQYISRGYVEAALFRPHVCIVETMSPNDSGVTQAAYDIQVARAIGFADWCARNNIVPILKTAVPYGSYTAAGDAFRQNGNAVIRGLGATGAYIVLDADALVTDGGSRAYIKPQFLGDSHLNDAGHRLIGGVAVGVIRRALGAGDGQETPKE